MPSPCRASVVLSTAAAVVATLSTLESAQAHSYMKFPRPTFQPGHWGGHWYAQVDGSTFNASAPLYKGRDRIAEILAATGDTLRKFAMDNMDEPAPFEGRTPTRECGFTLLDGARQPVPDHVDFPWVHPGPCEIWCDNTRVFYDVECQGHNVGNVTLDKAKCAGASVLQAMYVAVHAPPMWQVFTNCVPLEGGAETDASRVLDTNASGDGAEVSGEAAKPPPPSPSAAPVATTTLTPSPALTASPSAASPAPTSSSRAPTTPTASAPEASSPVACRRRHRV